MKSVVLALCFVGIATAAPQFHYTPVAYVAKPVVYSAAPLKTNKVIGIVSQTTNLQYDGNFNYDFKSEDGTVQEAVGSVKVLGPEQQAQVIQGRYAYTAPDGTPIEAKWWADETGFHVEGAHLPVAPPVPEAIARSLEYIRSLPPSKENQQ